MHETGPFHIACVHRILAHALCWLFALQAAACSCIGFGLTVQNQVLFPGEPILVTMPSNPERLIAMQDEDFVLVDGRRKKYPLKRVSLGMGGAYLALKSARPLRPGEYQVILSGKQNSLPGRERGFEYDPDWFVDRLEVIEPTGNALTPPGVWRPTGILFDGSSCDQRSLTFAHSNGSAIPRTLILARIHFKDRDYFHWSTVDQHGSLSVTSGGCGGHFPIGFLLEGRVELFEYRHGTLLPLGGWDYSVPPPEGWTAGRFSLLEQCGDEYLHASIKLDDLTPSSTPVSGSPMRIADECLLRSGQFPNQRFADLSYVLWAYAEFTSEQSRFKLIAPARPENPVPLSEVIPPHDSKSR